MKTFKSSSLLVLLLSIASCQPPPSGNAEAESSAAKDTTTAQTAVKDPCTNPITVAELKACAEKFAPIDSFSVSTGAQEETSCLNSWNANDTVIIIYYADSITLYRVQRWPNTKQNTIGSWFTNTNAMEAGLSKQQTLNKYALQNCGDFNYSTCVCSGGILPADTVIQYEITARIAPHEPLLFGIVGVNRFGQGGNLQWHYADTTRPAYRSVKQVRWN